MAGFVGNVIYWKEFIRDYASGKYVTRLIENHQFFQGAAETLQIFQQNKEHPSHAIALDLPPLEENFVPDTDASRIGLSR